MASLQFARNTSARNPLTVVPDGDNSSQETSALPSRKRRARLCPTPHLNVDQYVRLLAFVEDQGGVVTIDEVSRALPRVRQPVSAVFDLCDAGILNVDWESAFDGDMRVWRVDR